jgi:hypothetical protein
MHATYLTDGAVRYPTLIPLLLVAILGACADSTGTRNTTTAPATSVDATPVIVTHPDESETHDTITLMHTAYRNARALVDTTAPEVILADILAEEAHTLALAGAEDESVLLWAEAITLLESCTPVQTKSTSSPPPE